MKSIRKINKKAMSQFEVIGFAILAIVVIIVAIIIFTKLTKGPSDRIGAITNSLDKNQQSCVDNPASCNPLQAQVMDLPLIVVFGMEPSKL